MAVRTDTAARIASARALTHRAGAGRRAAEKPLAATRLRSVRASGLARVCTWLRAARAGADVRPVAILNPRVSIQARLILYRSTDHQGG